jgi:hypothetical protein
MFLAFKKWITDRISHAAGFSIFLNILNTQDNGLYPSSGMWKTKDHNVLETGSVSFLRWMGLDKPTQWGPLERASLNPWIFFVFHIQDDG